MILALSLMGIPAIRVNNDDTGTLQQFRSLYNLGKTINPKIAMLSATASFAAAWTHYHPQALYRTGLFVASGITTLSIVPWTFLMMQSTNSALFARLQVAESKPIGEAKSTEQSEETRSLLEKWRFLNIIRSLMPLAGSLLAYEAL